MNKEFLYQNKKIFYRTIGIGNPVILVHGFGEDGNVWRPFQNPPKEGLANSPSKLSDESLSFGNYLFIIPDLPGSGQSEMIDDMSIEGMAEVIHAIIHEENFNTCTVIGHSMGGYITLALAEKYWNHVNAFGLFHSTAFADSEEKKQTRKKGIDFIKQHGPFQFLKTSIPNLFSADFKKNEPDLINDFINAQSNFSSVALIAYYQAMINRPDRTNILKDTHVPVLFIAGEHDNAIPLEDMLKQCHLPGKSFIHILKKSGHMGMFEEPQIVNFILNEFLLESTEETGRK